jgi:hypothetical protein
VENWTKSSKSCLCLLLLQSTFTGNLFSKRRFTYDISLHQCLGKMDPWIGL